MLARRIFRPIKVSQIRQNLDAQKNRKETVGKTDGKTRTHPKNPTPLLQIVIQVPFFHIIWTLLYVFLVTPKLVDILSFELLPYL